MMKGMTDRAYKPFGHSAVEKTVLLLALANVLVSLVDRHHPMQVFYQGIVFLFEGWIRWIGWVMSLSDPLLPRAFTLPGTGNLIFSTAATVIAFLLAWLLLSRVWKKWCGPWLRERRVVSVLKNTLRHPALLYAACAAMAMMLLVSAWRLLWPT